MSEYPSIVWVGFHEEGRYALSGIIAAGFNVKALLTLRDESAAKRSGVYDFGPLAEEHGIPIHQIAHINDESTITLLTDLAPDVLCVIGWSQLLSAEALNTASEVVIGAHASLLPAGRGSAPVNWAIIKGMTKTGNTLMSLSEGVDSGDILAQREFGISVYDSCETLYTKVAQTNESMLLEVLQQLRSGCLRRLPQIGGDGALWPRRRPNDGLIDWNRDSRAVYDFMRALTRPYPGAFSYVDGKKVTVWTASLTDDAFESIPGRVLGKQWSFDPVLCAILVGCRRGRVAIHEAEVEGEGLFRGEELICRFESIKAFDANGK